MSVVPVVVALMLPGDDVTVYWVMELPPLEDGTLHDTDACALPAVALTPVGAPGVVAGVTALEAPEARLGPAPLVAVTVNV